MSKYEVKIIISDIPEKDYEEIVNDIEWFITEKGLTVDIGVGIEMEVIE